MQIVVAFAQVFGDVEEEWQVAAPVLAHHVTVHAHAAPLVDGTEMQDDPFPGADGRSREAAPVVQILARL